MGDSLLSLLVFVPLAAALLMAFFPIGYEKGIKWVALLTMLLQFSLSLLLFFKFDSGLEPGNWLESFQFQEQAQWITLYLGQFGFLVIDYHLGVDGISMLLVVLSAFLLVIGIISSWGLKEKVKGYFMLYMILSTSIVGCFVALDFFLFYLFFEFMLLPMFFLIGIWGGPRKSYASIKFFIYTLIGSLFILIVMIGLYLSTEDVDRSLELALQTGNLETVHTFSLVKMMEGSYSVGALLTPSAGVMLFDIPIRYLAFLLLFAGFAIKIPIVPVHTWLPDAHVEAPTAISVILAGLLLKVGSFGLLRIAYTIFPDGAVAFAYPIAIFGVLSIVYGGMAAMAQTDLKRLIAYSSVSHMGFVVLGLAALTVEGVAGSVFQMISHGWISGALFLLVGVVYDRTHDRKIENLSGLAHKMPVYTTFVIVFFFASLGLPGLSGFVGELLILIGGIGSESQNGLVPSWLGMLAVSGIIISAAYYLWTIQRMFFGKFWARNQEWEANLVDITPREWIMLLPLALAVIYFGIFPGSMLGVAENTVDFFTEKVLETGQRYLDLY